MNKNKYGIYKGLICFSKIINKMKLSELEQSDLEE